MGNILFYIVYIAITIGLMVLSFTFGRKYVFSKVRVNKWIILAISVVLFLVQFLVKSTNVWVTMLFTVVILWFFMWFMDIHNTGGPKQKEKKIEIRPKAKPNRVKHLKNQEK